MKIRLASSVMKDSVVDGEGLRTVIWTQGCPRRCPFCHNPETLDPKCGTLVEITDLLKDLEDSNDGITFSGGDPFMQAKECAVVAKELKKRNKNIWCYTGYTYEDLIRLAKDKKEIMDFLKEIDVLIDGPFIIDLKSLDWTFRGSTNQRIIDVPKSLKENKVIEITKYNKTEKEKMSLDNEVYI